MIAMEIFWPISSAFLLCALVSWTVFATKSNVVELRDSDFDYLATEHETMLVQFFAPWCGHCQKLAPEYEVAAGRLKGIVTLSKVDCSKNSQTCGRFGVKGFPTLKLFRNGKEASVYYGPHSAEGIVHYMQKNAGPSSVSLHNKADLDTFINNVDAGIVGFFSGDRSAQLAEFQKAASVLREDCRFAHTAEPALGLAHGLEGEEALLLFRPPRLHSTFEESVERFSGTISTLILRRFIKDKIFGICPHLTHENRNKLKGRDLLTAFYDIDYTRDPKGSNYWRNRLLKVASQFKSHGLWFSVANRQEFKKELEEEFGLGPSDDGGPPVVTIKTREGHKYTMREEFTRDGKALLRFLEDYFAGRLKRYIKSEPVPEHNNGPVKVVVAETFEEIVNDPEKNVLIEFYAPWCGHCKNLEPKYKQLGQQLSGDPNIIIAKMDVTANDVPSGYDIQGFPTIYFVPAKKKEQPVRYEGTREVKHFLAFLKREATHSVLRDGSRGDL